MFYRETGQYKTDYAADMALFPIRQDRIGIALILLVLVGGEWVKRRWPQLIGD